MEVISKNSSPLKDPNGSRSKNQQVSKSSSRFTENLDPNLCHSSPNPKQSKSPVIKSEKTQKSVVKNPNPVVYSPQKKIRQRKFIVAKKNLKKEEAGARVACKCGGNAKKCLCVAYESLRASQEEFFKNRGCNEGNGELDQSTARDRAEIELEEEIERKLLIQDLQIEDGYEREEEQGDDTVINESENVDPSETEPSNQMGSSTVKRRRDKLLEEARRSVPEPGSGRVMHLVQAFEKLLSIPISKNSDEKEEEDKQLEGNKNIPKWALPGLQPPKAPDSQVSSSSFCPSELFLTSENLGLDSRISVSSSWDSNQGSISSRTSNGGRRSRRNSTESSGTFGGRRWKKKQQLKATSQKPFKLRTEQRGRMKEEELMKKMQEMLTEEERQRIPIAQGLPWTTDEPECLIKPPVKEITRPVDLKLHSDIRAIDRAEFDHQVAEKMSLIEQYKMERERQRELAQEEEIRRLRKELVPKAQPMPYFDRPFIPRRSMKHPTIPREPKFHIPHHKKIKCCLSWNDLSSCTFEH
ncbi:protein TPX2 [Quillaja saponaria]|uniref:Protein TPX2 n=1 Tax=Quillaja saponaria TaxID=32244 RepID=A0AAD7Q3Q5_QUISA|nr:protein TPX2 [Quillaja saponaria]